MDGHHNEPAFLTRDTELGRSWRLPAPEVEAAVTGALQQLLSDHHQLMETLRLGAHGTRSAARGIRGGGGFPRQQGATRLLIPGRSTAAALTDPSLLKVIARAHAWFEELASGLAATVAEIARREQVTDNYVSCLMKRAFLIPDLVEDWLSGSCPPGLSARQVTVDVDLALLWSEQRDSFRAGREMRIQLR